MFQYPHSVEGQKMTESRAKKHVSGKSRAKKHVSGNRGITIHVSTEELERYHSLRQDQKRLIRAFVKMMIYYPQLLDVDESSYLYKLLTVKAVSKYICPLCLMPFGSSISLKQHIRYTEHGKTCPVCQREFANTDSALDHICKKHNICVG
jgi:hypothetical protein